MKSGQPTGDPIQSTDPSRRDPNKVYEVHTNKLEKAREAYQKAKQSVAQFFPAYRTPSSFSDPPTVMDVFQTLIGANPGTTSRGISWTAFPLRLYCCKW